jgi:hypothetical protein
MHSKFGCGGASVYLFMMDDALFEDDAYDPQVCMD